MNAHGNQKRDISPERDVPRRPPGKEATAPEGGGSGNGIQGRLLRLPHVLGIAVLITILDQLTKWVVVHNMNLHESYVLLPGIFSITRIHNTGIAFGLFPGMPDFFTIVTFISILVVFYFYITFEYRHILLTVGCGLIIGGATGNLLDRLRLHYVVDFIYFSFWPAFNVADSAVSVGVLLLMITFFLGEREARRNASDIA